MPGKQVKNWDMYEALRREGYSKESSARITNARAKGKKKMAKAKLGSGARFRQLKDKLARRKGVTNPGALAASIGRKKYGKKKFQRLAAKGRKRRGMSKTERGAYEALKGK